MNFTKSMIDLVREIRRKAPSEEKPSIKLANPDLFTDLVPWYHSTKDAVVKALIKELFNHAGGHWLGLLEKDTMTRNTETEAEGVQYVTKVYRGQTQLVEIRNQDATTSKASQKVYRGQVVR
ncbi:MAG: hypothetical protein ACRBBW_20640 [Cellvibrionaceae bacterium]